LVDHAAAVEDLKRTHRRRAERILKSVGVEDLVGSSWFRGCRGRLASIPPKGEEQAAEKGQREAHRDAV
jgi:hypothetical protein